MNGDGESSCSPMKVATFEVTPISVTPSSLTSMIQGTVSTHGGSSHKNHQQSEPKPYVSHPPFSVDDATRNPAPSWTRNADIYQRLSHDLFWGFNMFQPSKVPETRRHPPWFLCVSPPPHSTPCWGHGSGKLKYGAGCQRFGIGHLDGDKYRDYTGLNEINHKI